MSPLDFSLADFYGWLCRRVDPGHPSTTQAFQGMDWYLIRFLDFYFATMFFMGILRRFSYYSNIGELILLGPKRWPRLLQVLTQHRTIFLTGATVLPALMALLLSIVQLYASRLVWPEAGQPPEGLTLYTLFEHWPALFIVAPLTVGMIAMDVYSLVVVGRFDRVQMERYFDQAEYWLRSHTAHVVRMVTFGYVDPHQIVNAEVRKALQAVREMLHFTLWWVTIQVALRFACGLSLWLTWAWHR